MTVEVSAIRIYSRPRLTHSVVCFASWKASFGRVRDGLAILRDEKALALRDRPLQGSPGKSWKHGLLVDRKLP